MRNLFLTLTIISNLVLFSQTTNNEERLWEQGKLTWDDFNGTPPYANSKNASELNYTLSYYNTQKKVANTVFNFFTTKNSMNPDISWVKASSKSAQLLTYNQTLFNIIELHRRKLQKELYYVEFPFLAESKLRTSFQSYTYTIKEFQAQTEMGTNESELTYWNNKINTALQNTPLPELPEIEDGNWGVGMSIGVGTGIFTNTISNHFTSTTNLLFGFDIAYKKTILYLNGSLNFNKVKNDYTENGLTWNQGLKTGVAVIDVSIGQAIIDNNKHKLSPFAGLGVLEFTPRSSKEVYDDYTIVDYNLMYGINYDFKFRRTINLSILPNSFAAYKDKTEHNIRLRLYATSGSYENMKGNSINLAIGYSFFTRKISVK